MSTRDSVWPQGTPCWVDCQVDDRAAAGDFYSALFGWHVQDGGHGAGNYLLADIDGKAVAGIGGKPDDFEMASSWTTYIAAQNADDIARKVENSGGQLIMAPFDVTDVGRMFVAADPTGGIFGVWEAKVHKGAGVFNEDGAYCWNELHTRDYAKAKQFYSDAFGWGFHEIGDGENFAYSTFSLPGGDDVVGGINDASKTPGDHATYWLTWFQGDDVDAMLVKATGLGATEVRGPSDSPFGRSVVIGAPQGEIFGIIDPSKAIPPRT
jgi:hypothetical protein